RQHGFDAVGGAEVLVELVGGHDAVAAAGVAHQADVLQVHVAHEPVAEGRQVRPPGEIVRAYAGWALRGDRAGGVEVAREVELALDQLGPRHHAGAAQDVDAVGADGDDDVAVAGQVGAEVVVANVVGQGHEAAGRGPGEAGLAGGGVVGGR